MLMELISITNVCQGSLLCSSLFNFHKSRSLLALGGSELPILPKDWPVLILPYHGGFAVPDVSR